MEKPKQRESIVLGGGCFWCTEAVMGTINGVAEAVPGYAGGFSADPSYREVCDGATGHAEVVAVEYDPDQVSLEELLEVFFATHDPTSLNRQGADVGTQYRSIILYNSHEQKEGVERFMHEIAGHYEKPLVTEVRALEHFYPAEEYHRKYFEKNPGQPYCRAVISPKLAKLRKKNG